MVVDFIEFIFDDNFSQELNTVPVDFQVIHPDDGDDVVDDASTKAYFIDKELTVSVNPIFE